MEKWLARAFLWLGALLVVAWRLVALWHPHPAQTDPAAIRHAMALMGLWFLVCGVLTALRVPGRLAMLFGWYGVAMGMHWGGPVGFGPERVQSVQLALYLVITSILAQALFLHVAVAFDRPRSPARRRLTLTLVYLPSVVGGVLFLVQLTISGNRSLFEAFPILALAATLSSLVGAGVWIARWKRASRVERHARGLTRVAAAIVVGWLPYTLVSLGLDPWPDYSGLFNLPMVLEPTAVAMAVFAHRRSATESAGDREAPVANTSD